jgi:hypothetical protein
VNWIEHRKDIPPVSTSQNYGVFIERTPWYNSEIEMKISMLRVSPIVRIESFLATCSGCTFILHTQKKSKR